MSRNIQIITSDGNEFDYISPEALNIRLNRIADDMTDPSNRFGEYSYTFSLPKTKNNIRIFQLAGAQDNKTNFIPYPIDAQLFDDSKLLLDGQIELRSINDTYDCVFYSKLTQLIDQIKDKSLQDIVSLPHLTGFTNGVSSGVTFEEYISAHINADYQNSDETPFQFPFIFYNTFYTPAAVYSGTTDFGGRAFSTNIAKQNYYYILNDTTTSTNNEFYFHQFPLSFYIKPIIESILKDAGWSLGGSFFENENIKKIILPYVGDSDVYDKAMYCDEPVVPEVFPERYYLVIENVGQNGVEATGAGQYEYGVTVPVSVTLPSGYTFQSWNEVLGGAELSVTQTFNYVITKNAIIQPLYDTPTEPTIDCTITEI